MSQYPTKRVCEAYKKVKALYQEIQTLINLPPVNTREETLDFAKKVMVTSKAAKKLEGALKEWAQAIRAQERKTK